MTKTYLGRIRDGIEDLGCNFLGEAAKPVSPQKGVILFQNKTKEHTPFRYIYELIKEVKTLEEAKEIDYSKIKEPFRVKCRKKKGGELSSLDIERDLGEHIHEKHNKAVNLTEPKTIIIIEMIDDKIYVGKTEEDVKISKKEYRVKTNPNSLSGDIANVLLLASNFKPTKVLVDPFCGTGEILIEAALAKGKKLFGLDSNEFNIKKTKFNAKVAGVKLDLFKAEVDWLDTKFEENSVDHIVTSLPTPNKFLKARVALINYKDLFHQAKFILKKTGNLTIVTIRPNLIKGIPESEGLKEEKKWIVSSGDLRYYIIVYKK